MIILYLILAHLITDFVLQPLKLIEWKLESWKGVLFHVMIFVILSLFLLMPYSNHWQTWVAVLFIGLVHFISDQAKINVELRKDTKLGPFLVDQSIHLLSIILGGCFIMIQNFALPGEWFYENIYLNENIWVFLILIIFFGYVIDIIIFEYRRKTSLIGKLTGGKLPFRKNYIKMLQRIAVLSIVYILYMVLWVYLK
jgi:hypothetical protein